MEPLPWTTILLHVHEQLSMIITLINEIKDEDKYETCMSRNESGTVETLGSEEVANGDLSKLPREGATSGTG